MQLILRKQIAALRKLWNLPPEFEVYRRLVYDTVNKTEAKLIHVSQIICRDLWLLNLSVLDRPPPSEPWKQMVLGEHHDRGLGDEDNPIAKVISSQDGTGGTGNATKGASTTHHHPGSGSDSEESDSRIAEIDDLLDELSDLESERSDIDQQQEPESLELKGKKKRIAVTEHPLKPNESPMVNIAILHAACCIMRVPVICMDFIRCRVHIVIRRFEDP